VSPNVAACERPPGWLPVALVLSVPAAREPAAMALYRFLFAPVLLAAAVVAGPRGAERTPEPPRAAAHARVAAAPAVNPVPAVHGVPARADRPEARRASADR
jgi:hypothetical protein